MCPASIPEALRPFPDPSPDVILANVARRAAEAPLPSPSADISRTIRGDVPLPESVTVTDLQAHALEAELRQMRDRVRHLESALRAAGRVLQPYLAGNSR